MSCPGMQILKEGGRRQMTYEIPEILEIGNAEDLVQLTEMLDQWEGGSLPDKFGW